MVIVVVIPGKTTPPRRGIIGRLFFSAIKPLLLGSSPFGFLDDEDYCVDGWKGKIDLPIAMVRD
jgi:hypothetical protein